jgi:hypothetical protein
MNDRTRLALLGMVALLAIFMALPLLALAGRAAGLPSWTYGELPVTNTALARGWALMPAWLLMGVAVLSIALALPAIHAARIDQRPPPRLRG